MQLNFSFSLTSFLISFITFLFKFTKTELISFFTSQFHIHFSFYLFEKENFYSRKFSSADNHSLNKPRTDWNLEMKIQMIARWKIGKSYRKFLVELSFGFLENFDLIVIFMLIF